MALLPGGITRLWKRMRRPRIPYYTSMIVYANDEQVISEGNSIIFINQGVAPVQINNALVLQTGQSISITGNQHEFDTTIYQLLFQPAVAGDLQRVVCIRKTYNSDPGDQWVYPGIELKG